MWSAGGQWRPACARTPMCARQGVHAHLLCTLPCTLCEQVMAGQLKTGEQIRAELKASISSLLQQRGGSAELALPEAKPAVLLVRLLLGWVGRRRVAGLAGHAALFGRDRSIAARAGVCAFTGA